MTLPIDPLTPHRATPTPKLPPPLAIVAELAWKPAWSVLSLADLNAAIRREHDQEEPARRERAAERAERARIQAIIAESNRLAAAERDRYRNAWEHA
jgi:hypothetical protein